MTPSNLNSLLPFPIRIPSYRMLFPLLGIGGATGLLTLARGNLPPPLLWGLVALLLVAGVAVPLAHHWQRRHAATPDSGTVSDRSVAALHGLRESLNGARQKLRAGRDGGKAALAQPWFYLIGDSGLGTAILRDAATAAPLPPPDPASLPDSPWHFWFLRDSVIVQLTDDIPAGDDTAGKIWPEMLMAGRALRPGLAANGILAVLPLDLLLDPAGGTARQNLLQRLRGQVHGLQEGLAAELPVHVLLAGFDRLPGAASLLATLPPAARRQALGHVFADGSGPDLNDLPAFAMELATVMHRLRLGWLDHLRLSLQAALEREAAFRLAETINQIIAPLSAFLADLLAPAALQHPVRLRSLYVVGGADHPAFTQDALGRLIPRDGALARPLAPASDIRRRLALAGTLGLAVLSGAGLFWLLYSDPALERTATDAQRICAGTGGRGSLVHLADCGDALLAFDRAVDTTGAFGWYRPVMQIRGLRQGWAESWADQVGKSLRQQLQQELDEKRTKNFGLAVSLAQASLLALDCGSEAGTCAALAQRQGELGRRLSSLGTPQRLLRLHGTHLAWLNSARRAEDRAALSALGQRLWQGSPPSLTDLLAWGNDRTPPLSLGHFWGVAENLPSQTLAGAFTATAWETELAPALDAIARHGGAPEDRVTALRRGFMEQRQTGWSRFLSRFGDGVMLRSNDPQGLKALLARPDENPFDRLARELEAAVMATTPADQQRPWVKTLQPFLKSDWHQAMGWLREAMEPLVADPSGQTGYKLAAEALQAKGSAGADLSAPLWRAVEMLEKARLSLPPGEATPEDRAALELLKAAPRAVLLVALADAGRHIDSEWRRQVRVPALEKPRGERLAFLASDQGAVARFAGSVLAPFQSGATGALERALGLELPLSGEFQDLAARLRQPGAQGSGNLAGQLAISGISQIGTMAEGAQGTQLIADCPRKAAAVSSIGSLTERRAPLYWDAAGCLALRLIISVPTAVDPSGTGQLILEWRGPDMLTRAAQRLKGGRVTFRLRDFNHNLTAEAQQALSGGQLDVSVSVDAAIQLIKGFDPAGSGPEDLPLSIMQPLL
jgi:hypothetical protein